MWEPFTSNARDGTMDLRYIKHFPSPPFYGPTLNVFNFLGPSFLSWIYGIQKGICPFSFLPPCLHFYFSTVASVLLWAVFHVWYHKFPWLFVICHFLRVTAYHNHCLELLRSVEDMKKSWSQWSNWQKTCDRYSCEEMFLIVIIMYYIGITSSFL